MPYPAKFDIGRFDQSYFDQIFLPEKEYSSDAILCFKKVKDYSIDSVLSQRKTQSYFSGGQLYKPQTINLSTDALLRKAQTKQYPVDVALKKTEKRLYSIDSLIGLTNETPYTINALIIEKNKIKSYCIDTFLVSAQAVLHFYPADALLQKQFSIDYINDAYLENIAVYSSDAVLWGRQQKSYFIDSCLYTCKSQPYTADALLSRLLSYTSDAICIKPNLEITYLADAYMQSVEKLLQATISISNHSRAFAISTHTRVFSIEGKTWQ